MLQKDGGWTVWHRPTSSDGRWWTVSFERRNRARNLLLSYFVSASSRSLTSRHLLGFITLKNSRISMSVFVQSAISFWFTCVKSRVQRLIARNRRFRFKLKFKADRVQLKMVQRTIVVNQFTAAYLIEFTAEPRWCNRPLDEVHYALSNEPKIVIVRRPYAPKGGWKTQKGSFPCKIALRLKKVKQTNVY